MSQTPVTVTYSLEEVLGQINQKLDTLQKDVADFRTETKVAMEGVKGEVNGLKGDVYSIKEDIKKLKGSQKAQVWTLIGILGTAVAGTAIRLSPCPLVLISIAGLR